MPDLPRRAVTRSAKLATLPLGLAGRATVGLGRRLGGRPAEEVNLDLQARTADQLFRVLGELKGGAMKVGQAMSIFEAALPEDVAAPYRDTLVKLQDSAPPMPAATVHRVLAASFGADWRSRFSSFDDSPGAAASIGQVHRAVWADGRRVAVKVQYPGAAKALLGDFTQLARMARLFGRIAPNLDLKELLAELRQRVEEELDYALEAQSQEQFARAYDGDPDVAVPAVVASAGSVLVTEWLDGTPLARIIATGTREERDHAGLLLVRFLFSSPSRAGLLHADPHPGNYRILDDGRLGVLDFGAVARLPDGLPPSVGPLLRRALADDAFEVLQGLREESFVKESVVLDPDELLGYLAPFIEPARVESFHFTRAWLQEQASRVGDPRSAPYRLATRLNLPASYALIHRVWLGGVGVLCQLDAEAPFRGELRRWLPGFDQPAPSAR